MLAELATTTAVLPAALDAAKTTTTTLARKGSATSTLVLFLFVILIGGYFLYMRPRSRARLQQQRQAQSQARTLEVGDEVATSAGIVGRVRRIGEDRVELKIAPGMRIQVLRQNLGRPLEASSLDGTPLDSGAYGSDGYGSDGDGDWSDHDASQLAPGGQIDDEDVNTGGGSAGLPASTTSPRPGATRSPRSRSRRRPSGAPRAEERAPGWSLTSDSNSLVDDDGPTGGSAAGTSG